MASVAPYRKTIKPRKRFADPTKLTPSQRAEVRKMLGSQIEKKYLNAIIAQTGVSSTSGLQCITEGIQQGTTDSQRVGDTIKLTKIYLRLFWGIGDSENFMRFIVFQWKPSDQTTAPTAADILLPGASSIVDISSQYNHDKRSLFKILFDKTISMNGDGTGAGSPDTSTSRGFCVETLLPKVDRVSFEAATVRGMGHIYVLSVSDSTIIPHPYIYYSMKVMYTDA